MSYTELHPDGWIAGPDMHTANPSVDLSTGNVAMKAVFEQQDPALTDALYGWAEPIAGDTTNLDAEEFHQG